MKLERIASFVGGLIALAHGGSCWGNLGHRTIAYLAEKHFTEKGKQYATELLGGEDISDAAIWADDFKNTDAGRHTGSWHFVDAKDNPPQSCDVRLDRDCTANRTCIITAISNMTSQLLTDPSPLPLPPPPATTSSSRRNQAFKFLLHLIGDVHHPLHAEGIARGGNDLAVVFAGADTNLHLVWDVAIPLKRTRSSSSGGRETEVAAARVWAETLFRNETMARRRALEYGGVTARDIAAVSEEWALDWAREANAWVCRYVLKDGLAALAGRELEGDYFERAVPIVDELVSSAGRRLGMLVNALAVSRHSTTGAVVPPRVEL